MAGFIWKGNITRNTEKNKEKINVWRQNISVIKKIDSNNPNIKIRIKLLPSPLHQITTTSTTAAAAVSAATT